MTEKELKEIESIWCSKNDLRYPEIYKLVAEVRRLNRMVDKAIKYMESGACLLDDEPCPENYIEVGCHGCVIKYLESEEAK